MTSHPKVKLPFLHFHVLIYSNVSQEDSVDEDDDEDSSDDDSVEDEDERKAVKPPPQSDSRIYTALSDFSGEQEGDLSVRVKYFLFQRQR